MKGDVAMVVIAAIVEVNDGKGAEFEKEFLQLQQRVVNEPGTIAYALHRSTDNPCKYFILEEYDSDHALKYHTSTDHFKAALQKMGPLMRGNPEVGYYTEVK
jgi:quinol monooxygenase YgiN